MCENESGKGKQWLIMKTVLTPLSPNGLRHPQKSLGHTEPVPALNDHFKDCIAAYYVYVPLVTFFSGWRDFSSFESNLCCVFLSSFEAYKILFPGSIKSLPKSFRALISPHQFFLENGVLAKIQPWILFKTWRASPIFSCGYCFSPFASALGVLICSRNLYYAPSKSAAFIYTLWIFLLNSSEFHKCDSSLIQLPDLPWLLLLLQKEIILLNVLILNRCSYLTSKSLCLICFSRFIFVSFFNITEYFNRF